jgi:hypothetical protein
MTTTEIILFKEPRPPAGLAALFLPDKKAAELRLCRGAEMDFHGTPSFQLSPPRRRR